MSGLNLRSGDDIPRIIQHLGPEYCGLFQTKDLFQFLTYEASTSLNILLSSLADRQKKAAHNHGGPDRVAPSAGPSALRFLKDGINVAEESFIFSASAVGFKYGEVDESGRISPQCVRNGATAASSAASRDPVGIVGDVTPVLTESLDIALWKIGGPAVALRIVELANVSYSLLKLR